MIVREIRAADVGAVADIYAHHVLTGFGTFEETPPSHEEMVGRIGVVHDCGLPYLVAENGHVRGFAYASIFRPRAAYRFTVEDSVYVRHDAIGQGVGRALLRGVIDRCVALGLRQMMAIIGDSGNAASIGLHRALGFSGLGVGCGVGFKRGRWLDIVWMQRALAGGDSSAPDGAGSNLDGG